jgi:hypothetical protein
MITAYRQPSDIPDSAWIDTKMGARLAGVTERSLIAAIKNQRLEGKQRPAGGWEVKAGTARAWVTKRMERAAPVESTNGAHDPVPETPRVEIVSTPKAPLPPLSNPPAPTMTIAPVAAPPSDLDTLAVDAGKELHRVKRQIEALIIRQQELEAVVEAAAQLRKFRETRQ